MVTERKWEIRQCPVCGSQALQIIEHYTTTETAYGVRHTMECGSAACDLFRRPPNPSPPLQENKAMSDTEPTATPVCDNCKFPRPIGPLFKGPYNTKVCSSTCAEELRAYAEE